MLHTIFRPAMHVMSRLRFALKLGLIGVLFMIPLAGLVYFLDDEITTTIATVQTERLGLLEIVPARRLLEAVQTHRGMSQIALSGDQAAKEKLGAIASKIEEQLRLLNVLSETAAASLGTTEAVTNLQRQWSELSASNNRYTPDESFEKHSALTGSILDFLKLVADKSGLTLDPEMDSFYLVDATAFRMPDVIESVGRLRGHGSGILKRQAMRPDEKTELVVLRRFYGRDFQTLQGDLTKALNANAALASVLDAKVKEARSAGEHFLNNEAAALVNGDLSVAPIEFFNRATAVKDTLFKLFDASVEQLDSLLAARIHKLETNLAMILGGVGIVAALVLYLFIGMLLSVLRSLRSIQAGAQRLAQGDVSQLVDSHSRDELREVGGAVNTVINTLDKFIKAQLEMARAHNQDGRISEEMRPATSPAPMARWRAT